MKRSESLHLSEWAGMLGPPLFVTVFTIEGIVRPEYEPVKMFVSALSLGDRGWIQITNFIVFGTMLLIFSRRVALEFPSGKESRAGPLLLAIIAICYLLSGPFVMDPVDTSPDDISVHGLLHGVFGGMVFTLMPIICFVFWRRFRIDLKWHRLAPWTLLAGIAVTSAVVLLTAAAKVPAARDAFQPWLGLIQRAAIVPFMVWLFVFALHFGRR